MMMVNLLAALNGAGVKSDLGKALEGGHAKEKASGFALLLAHLTGSSEAAHETAPLEAEEPFAALKALLSDEALPREQREALAALIEVAAAYGQGAEVEELPREDGALLALIALALYETAASLKQGDQSASAGERSLALESGVEGLTKAIGAEAPSARPPTGDASALTALKALLTHEAITLEQREALAAWKPADKAVLWPGADAQAATVSGKPPPWLETVAALLQTMASARAGAADAVQAAEWSGQMSGLLDELARLFAGGSDRDGIKGLVPDASEDAPPAKRFGAVLKALAALIESRKPPLDVGQRLTEARVDGIEKPASLGELVSRPAPLFDFNLEKAEASPRDKLQALTARLESLLKAFAKPDKDTGEPMRTSELTVRVNRPPENGTLFEGKPFWLRSVDDGAPLSARSNPAQLQLSALLQRMAANAAAPPLSGDPDGNPASREAPPEWLGRFAQADPRSSLSGEFWRLGEGAGGKPAKPATTNVDHSGGGNAGRWPLTGVMGSTERVGSTPPGAALGSQSFRVTMHELNDQVVRNVRYLVHQGEQSLQVRLVPESLGEMRIQVTMGGEAMRVHLASANPFVREALEAQLGQLRESFAREGLDVGRVTVGADMNQGNGAAGHGSRLFQPPAGAGSLGQGGGQNGPREAAAGMSERRSVITDNHIDVRV